MDKACFKCGETKALDAFYKHPMMLDGHLNKCKDCAKKDVREHRLENADKVRAYDRERGQLPHRKEQRQQIQEAERRNHPDRVAARYAVSNALRDGKLERKPCAFCHSDGAVEAHHHDYSRPLDVTWLCRPCHRRFHALERMATYHKQDAA